MGINWAVFRWVIMILLLVSSVKSDEQDAVDFVGRTCGKTEMDCQKKTKCGNFLQQCRYIDSSVTGMYCCLRDNASYTGFVAGVACTVFFLFLIVLGVSCFFCPFCPLYYKPKPIIPMVVSPLPTPVLPQVVVVSQPISMPPPTASMAAKTSTIEASTKKSMRTVSMSGKSSRVGSSHKKSAL